MQITFYRHGHANNSSSSHSVVFLPDKESQVVFSNRIDDTIDWNWDSNAGATTPTTKAMYVLWCLKNQMFGYDDSQRKKTKEKTAKWLHTTFSKFITEKDAEIIANLDQKPDDDGDYLYPSGFGGYMSIGVDHQSVITFPNERQTGLININFVEELLEELVKPEYGIQCGNDNGDDYHVVNSDLYKNYMNDIFDFMKNTYGEDKEYLAVKDPGTKEWILSSNQGLMRIRFSADEIL